MSEAPDRLPRPVLSLLAFAFACLVSLALAGCPDDVASTDLAQPKDQGAAVQDAAGKD